MKESLQEIWSELAESGYETDKGSVHSYIEVYEEILAPYRNTASNIIEIGVFKGNSIIMWDVYFSCQVHGIDCSITPLDGMADLRPMIENSSRKIHILDATDEAQIEKEFGDTKWDVVIDDGSHLVQHQVQTINIFKDRMNKGGIIVLEDIQDIDKDGWIFNAISGNFTVEILDRRHIKGRYDDCLVILRFN